MSRKAIDARIPTLIRNGVQEKKRSFFVVTGDHSKDIIVNLYHIMRTVVGQDKPVLWAYKKKLLGFTSHRQKREKKIKKEIKHGIRDANSRDPFELFVSLDNIRYVYYKETDKILGNTFGMCILQDFEALTPNILARTIETVEGGGLVVLLLRGVTSLNQVRTIESDVHARYRTEAHRDVVPRFNERFILSLASCTSCLVIDDDLNVQKISGGRAVQPLPPPEEEDDDADADANGAKTEDQRRLAELKDQLRDTPPVGQLMPLARTLDQGQALLTFTDAVTEKTLQSTVVLTAARGRGKSAAMGLAVAAAVAHGYANIFITSPSPENLKTLFEFVFRGFDALGYQDFVDYTIIQSTNPDLANKPVVRVNIHRSHRQTIQYIRPQDAHVLGQAELLVIDEAAAIPLPLVRKLIGPYLVFMSTTVNGYEGTGRSLSLKLVKELREQSRGSSGKAKGGSKAAGAGAGAGAGGTTVADRATGRASKDAHDFETVRKRSLREITLSEPIRYARGDAVEKWLNAVLCLDATLKPPGLASSDAGYPDPAACELLRVNRDTLFSYHPVTERFLQQMVSLYVASHYKNTPDDLQLMSDAPAHELFVLVRPLSDDRHNRLPEPLCVVQVALEGRIGHESVMRSLSRGVRPAGDLIPWVIREQFQDDEFPSLSGARIVRIATSPDYVSKGYGARALKLLVDFYSGEFGSLDERDADGNVRMPQEPTMTRVSDADPGEDDNDLRPRDIASMPPLFSRLSDCHPPALDYVGVSYGLTQQLLKFWKRVAFAPVYLRQTPNDLTGEHTCVMLRPLTGAAAPSNTASDPSWLGAFTRDFHRRFLNLLPYPAFRTMSPVMALSLSEAARNGSARFDPAGSVAAPLTYAELLRLVSPYDLKRLESYTNNRLDYHLILDLVHTVADLYFTGRITAAVDLTGVNQCILLALGMQRKDMDDVLADMPLNMSGLMGMFLNSMMKVMVHFGALYKADAEAEASTGPRRVLAAHASAAHDDEEVDRRFEPVSMTVDEELAQQEDDQDDQEGQERRQRARELIDSLPLDQYEIEQGDDGVWADAERQVAAGVGGGGGGGGNSTTVSVKSSKPPKRKKGDPAAAEAQEEVRGGKEKKKKKQRRQ